MPDPGLLGGDLAKGVVCRIHGSWKIISKHDFGQPETQISSGYHSSVQAASPMLFNSRVFLGTNTLLDAQ